MVWSECESKYLAWHGNNSRNEMKTHGDIGCQDIFGGANDDDNDETMGMEDTTLRI